MSRRRDLRRHLVLPLACAAAVFSGCIFSPDKIPPEPPPVVDSPTAFIRELARIYQARNPTDFENLLAENYLFILNAPDPDTGEMQWGRTTEIRIHQRMFRPEDFSAGQDPVPAENWLQSVDITLTPRVDFVERPDLYTTATPPGELDPARWIAKEGFYGTYVFFQLAGDVDFQVNGQASFVVIEDRTKNVGDPGKFLLFRWSDLGDGTGKPSRPPV